MVIGIEQIDLYCAYNAFGYAAEARRRLGEAPAMPTSPDTLLRWVSAEHHLLLDRE
jgi:hypothetical protein